MKIRWDPSISAGALLQAAVVIVGIIGFFYHVQGALERHEVQIISHAETLRNLSATQADLAQNLKVLTAIVNERTARKP